MVGYNQESEKYETLNPVAYDLAARGVNLPCAMILTEEQIKYVCEAVQTILHRHDSPVVHKAETAVSSQQASQEEIKLNLGCGSRPLAGYVNVDLDTLEQLQARYPNIEFPEDVEVFQYDIFHLPFADGSVAEIRADSLLEHLSFLEERQLFYEVQRVLRAGGIFDFSVPDFEETTRLWLEAKDEWKDFFRNDPEAIAQQHWFGQYSYSTESRWGYLTASIYGPQNSSGQFHKNCYTIPKIRAILQRLAFEELEISHYHWKGDRNLMIHVRARKTENTN